MYQWESKRNKTWRSVSTAHPQPQNAKAEQHQNEIMLLNDSKYKYKIMEAATPGMNVAQWHKIG
jgi:hypothetical protein